MKRLFFKSDKGNVSWIAISLAALFILVIGFVSFYFSYKTYSIASSHSFFINDENVENPSEASFWLGFTGIILSFISIVTVVVTLIMQLRELDLQKCSLEDNYKISEDNYNAYVLQLIEKFLGPEMSECRQTCWLLRQQIKSDPKALDKMQSLFSMQIRDDCGTREEYEKLQKTQSFCDYSRFTKLIRFFDMLSHYNITKETAYAIHFYYVWWRSFFIEMINCYKTAESSIPIEKINLSVSPSWCDLIERMDSQMLKHGLSLV